MEKWRHLMKGFIKETRQRGDIVGKPV